MINFDGYTNENKTEHNSKQAIYFRSSIQNINNWRLRIKKNKCIFKFNKRSDIDNIYLYEKDQYESKYQFLIKKRESIGLKHFNDLKAFIEYSNDIQDVYKNIEEYNINKKRKILIVFDDLIADIINNKELNPIVTELFIRERKLNISVAFITRSYFKVPKDVRLNSTLQQSH